MFLSVALLSPPYTTLTYAAPTYLPERLFVPGLRVLVPLGSMVRSGLVLDAGVSDPGADVAVRAVIWPLERRPLCASDGYLVMVRGLAARQMCLPGQVLGTVLPADLRTLRMTLRIRHPGKKPVALAPSALARLPEAELQAAAEAWNGGNADWVASPKSAAETETCTLLADPPWRIRPGARRQLAMLEWVLEHPGRSRSDLMQAMPGAGPVLDSLIRAGILDIRPLDADHVDEEPEDFALPPPSDSASELTEAQRACVDRFTEGIHAGRASVHLLYGVTGSGKTRVYIETARACLAAGKSVMLLAPEVALALKLRRDVECGLSGAEPVLFHGYQSSPRRAAMFTALAAESRPRIIVGTRSALFLPVANLGLIVLDEEHDASYKQDEGLAYQAKELAYLRAWHSGSVLVLGSATPDVKTFHAAQSGLMGLAALPGRVGGGTMPEVRLVSIRDVHPSTNLFSEESLRALRQCVADGNQAVVLLNLRGYAPRMLCQTCGKVLKCPQCDIGLTYHKGRERMVCHYCGYTLPFPCLCPECRSMEFTPMGQGTERVEEFLARELPPGTNVLRLDRDSTRREGRMEEILSAFARGEAQVLVGTQMLSKGHHFPNVALVLVVDGDIGLNTPDYRATERTFQLLVQSAGRAGRGTVPGKVIVQTRDPSHYCWDFVLRADYEGFYANEIARRKVRLYPPFVKLGLIRLSYPQTWGGGDEEIKRLAAVIRRAGAELGVKILGPAPAVRELLRGRRRFSCLIKAQDWPAVRRVYAALLAAEPDKRARVSLDLDPMDMS